MTMTSDLLNRLSGISLEEFRLEKGLSYRKLASLIGLSHASQARSWAIGEARPDADQMEIIVRRTTGAVTVEAMHRKRLAWLRENNKCSPELAEAGANGEAPSGVNDHAA